MVEKTPGGRTAAEIVERARVIQKKHFFNWLSEAEKLRLKPSPDERPMSPWEEARQKALQNPVLAPRRFFGFRIF